MPDNVPLTCSLKVGKFCNPVPRKKVKLTFEWFMTCLTYFHEFYLSVEPRALDTYAETKFSCHGCLLLENWLALNGVSKGVFKQAVNVPR